jgi:hypothetical protein
MPNRDKTGPEGKGPRTGRQMGNCENVEPTEEGLGPYGRGLKRNLRKRFAKNSSRNKN